MTASRSLPLIVPALALLMVRASAEDDRPTREYPVIPGASSTIRWDPDTAPFNVPKLIHVPGRHLNGAALCLDAIFEFSPEVQFCFPEEQRQQRAATARQRIQRWQAIRKIDGEQVDALIAEHADGFRKLREAQRRPVCVFRTGMDFEAILPHAQAARQIARIVALKAFRDLQTGKLDDCLSDVDMTLRLARDLSRRGFLINGLVAKAMESMMFSQVIGPVLASPRLTAKHCDRILRILDRHLRKSRGQFIRLLQMEYISTRTFLHDLEHQVGTFDPKQGKLERHEKVKQVLGSIEVDDDIDQAARRILAMTADDFRYEVEQLNHAWRVIAECRGLPFARRMEKLTALRDRATKNTKVLGLVMPAFPVATKAFVRAEARIAGFQCLTGVRRWQIAHQKKGPVSLSTAMLASGLRPVPIDPYSDKPMMLTWRRNEPVVYSIGPDGNDDKGLVDWAFGKQPGDLLFRIPKN